jgi:hypothetical protein
VIAIFRLQCIVHQEVFISKTIKKCMYDVDLTVTKYINEINRSSVLSNTLGFLCNITDKETQYHVQLPPCLMVKLRIKRSASWRTLCNVTNALLPNH